MNICIKAYDMLSDCSNANSILRIYEADICQKVKNTEAETKKHYSYKKACVVKKNQHFN